MRQYPDRPIVGVGAVIVDGDRVLLVKRAHEPLKGEWSLPGGAVEVGESLEAALVREVREETCLDVTVGPVVEAGEALHAAVVREVGEETCLDVEVRPVVEVLDRISRDEAGRDE